MIKAEVVNHPGTEVPNWLTKCKDMLTSAPALGVLALTIVAVLGVITWQHNRPVLSNTSSTQSQPVATATLQVVPATTATAANQVPVSTLPNATASAPVGPAPTSSLGSLQSTGATQNGSTNLTQAAGQTIQSAGTATVNSLHNLGL